MSKECIQVKAIDIVDLLYDIYDVPSGICEQIKNIIQRLAAIDDGNPNEALDYMESLFKCWENLAKKDDLEIKEIELEKYIFKENYDILKQALQQKIAWKHIHNTKVRVPLIQIFNGKTQEEKHQIIEHIYYNWEEMKEALEDKNRELEEKNAELKTKAQEQEKAIKIIFEKNVDIEYIKTCFYDLKGGLKEYNAYVGHDEDRELTQEEFELLKRWRNE